MAEGASISRSPHASESGCMPRAAGFGELTIRSASTSVKIVPLAAGAPRQSGNAPRWWKESGNTLQGDIISQEELMLDMLDRSTQIVS